MKDEQVQIIELEKRKAYFERAKEKAIVNSKIDITLNARLEKKRRDLHTLENELKDAYENLKVARIRFEATFNVEQLEMDFKNKEHLATAKRLNIELANDKIHQLNCELIKQQDNNFLMASTSKYYKKGTLFTFFLNRWNSSRLYQYERIRSNLICGSRSQ